MDKKIRVLIIDDNPHARHGLRAILDVQPQIDVIGEGADGAEAVRMAEDRYPDVILMDICLPVMDGIEATRIIKTRSPKLRVIAISMYSDYQEAVLAAGAEKFIVKGYPPNELVDVILEK